MTHLTKTLNRPFENTMPVKETWMRWGLYFAGAWNLLGGVMAFADPAAHLAQMYDGAPAIDNPLHLFFFRATWINVMAWGIGYLLAGRLRAARIPVLCAGGVGKLAYFAACMALVQAGTGKPALAAAAIIDVVFAVFFAYALWSSTKS